MDNLRGLLGNRSMDRVNNARLREWTKGLMEEFSGGGACLWEKNNYRTK